MEISIGNQLLTILNSFFLGIFVSFIYQIFKIIRFHLIKEFSINFTKKMKDKTFKNVVNPLKKKRKHKAFKRIFESIVDFSYFLVITPIYTIFFFQTSNGIVRWYVFAFSLVGFFVFQITVGKIINKILEYIGFYFDVFISFIIYKINKILKQIYKRKIKPKKHRKEKKQVLLAYGK